MEESPNVGVKYDSDKPKWSLMPWEPLLEVLEVLQFGAQKYSPDNWKKIDDPKTRYFDAAHRHLYAWWTSQGAEKDPQSGKSHLAHAVASLLFLIWFDNRPVKDDPLKI